MKKAILATLGAAIVLLLVACGTTPAQPVNLKPVTDAITDLSGRVDTLAARLDHLSEEVAGTTGAVGGVDDRVSALAEDLAAVAGGLDGLEGDVEILTRAALDLQQVVTQPLDLANFDWGALTGVVVQTVPATAEVTIEPGECPAELSRGHAGVLGMPIIGTSFHAAPAGTHCLRTLADETHQESGVTVTIPDGVIVTAALLPLQQPAE